MYLVIDRGNTLLKIALFDGDEMAFFRFFKNISKEEVDKVIAEIASINTPVEFGIISNVTDRDIPAPVIGLTDHYIEFDHNTPLPVKLKYRTPETIGKDRIALAVGASELYPKENILIIGAGTTITYDFVNNKNEYLGGGISPGINMRFRALNTFTGKLPLINPAGSDELIGDSTEQSIRSGVINGTRKEVKGIIEAYKEKYPGLRIVLTGGDMKYFDKYLKSNTFAVANLVMKGLKDILRYNVEKLR